MPRNGSGLYVPPPANYPAVSATLITAADRNAIDADLATALTNSLAVNGESVVTADIPFGNNKLTGVKDGTSAKDAANVSQIQNSNAILLASVAGTDTITASLSPALTAYANGQIFTLIPANSNTGAVTININGLGAKALTKNGSTALVAGDLVAGVEYSLQYDGTRFQKVAGSDYAKSGANSDITSLAAVTSINSGPLAGFRNYIINGECKVAQGDSQALSNIPTYGTVDLFRLYVFGGTGISGTLGRFELNTSELGTGVSASSWTNGKLAVETAIESTDARRLNGQTVTVSATVYQNTGAAVDYVIRVIAPTVTDNYTAYADIGTAPTVSVPSGTPTTISRTLTLGSTDATKGLAIYIHNTTAITVSNKNFIFGNFQLVEGSVVSPIENVPYPTVLSQCQRYYEVGGAESTFSGNVTSGSIYYNPVNFKATKRATPTVTTSDVGNAMFAAGNPTTVQSLNGFYAQKTANATGAGYFQYSWKASSFIL